MLIGLYLFIIFGFQIKSERLYRSTAFRQFYLTDDLLNNHLACGSFAVGNY